MRWTIALIIGVVLLAIINTVAAAFLLAELWQNFNNDMDELQPVLQVMDLVEEHYAGEVDRETLVEGAVRGMLDSLDDPHTTFLDQEELEHLQIQTRGTYGGVGIILAELEDQLTVVEEPMPESPAREAGIREGDVITAVDGREVEDMTFDLAAQAIRGEKGTEVLLEVERDGDELEFELVRDDVQLVTVSSRMLEEQPEIGYLRISLFTEHTSREVREALQELEGQGMEELVLDLRANPGGTLMGALNTAEHFVPAGEPLLYVVDETGEEQTVYSEGGSWEGLPLVVLVDEASASGAEITAAALQGNDRAELVGETTYGKGSVQSLYPLAGGQGVKLTTGLYFSPRREVIHEEGVEPDHRVEGDEETEDDEQLEAALRVLAGSR